VGRRVEVQGMDRSYGNDRMLNVIVSLSRRDALYCMVEETV